MKIIDSGRFIDIPPDVAKCPKCGAAIYICEIDHWEAETGRIDEEGFFMDCETEPDFDSDEYDEWDKWHWSTPYIDWLPLRPVVYQWLDKNYRVAVES